jgi:YidC/Oxa1 family membrane protein insertase
MSKLPNKDIPTEQRLMLAFGLMIVILAVTTYLMPKPPEQKAEPAKKAEVASAPVSSSKPPSVPSPTKPTKVPAVAAAVARIEAASESTSTIETDLVRVVFSNRGAVAKSWVLKAYKDSKGQPIELVNAKAVDKYGFPFSYRYHGDQSADTLNNALHRTTVSGDRRGIEFEYYDGTWHGTKSLRFTDGSYLVAVESQVKVAGVGKPHLLSWRGGFGDYTVVGAASQQKNVYFEAGSRGLTPKTADTAAKEPQANRGRFDFAGIADAYFAAVAVPETPQFELHTFQDLAPNHLDGKEDPFPGMAVGGDASNKFPMFVGPKDTALLKRVSPKLEQLVDFGYFAIVARPLFETVRYIQGNYIRNYGWTIVAVTILINLLLMPLKISSLKSMKQMSALQPEIKKIQERYAGMSLKDPRKANQNQEMMDLYKKHGINPMGGCMPMALQIPFFIAFYNVLSNAIELRGASWLWVSDLSRMDSLYILPVAMVATQFLMQKMTPATTADPAQQRMLLFMPLMLGFMFWSVMSGLVLYWLTGNVVGIAQQWLFNRMGHKPAPAAVQATPTKKK